MESLVSLENMSKEGMLMPLDLSEVYSLENVLFVLMEKFIVSFQKTWCLSEKEKNS